MDAKKLIIFLQICSNIILTKAIILEIACLRTYAMKWCQRKKKKKKKKENDFSLVIETHFTPCFIAMHRVSEPSCRTPLQVLLSYGILYCFARVTTYKYSRPHKDVVVRDILNFRVIDVKMTNFWLLAFLTLWG